MKRGEERKKGEKTRGNEGKVKRKKG